VLIKSSDCLVLKSAAPLSSPYLNDPKCDDKPEAPPFKLATFNCP
jgi:hypothetical protein